MDGIIHELLVLITGGSRESSGVSLQIRRLTGAFTACMYIIGVAPNTQLRTCVNKIVTLRRSPNVVKVIFHTKKNFS